MVLTSSQVCRFGTKWNVTTCHAGCQPVPGGQAPRTYNLDETFWLWYNGCSTGTQRLKQLEQNMDRNKRFRDNRRKKIILHYSEGICKCALCNESIYEFLTIDHINGGGKRHRQNLGGTDKLYDYLIKEGFPTGYRILCWNCNCAAGLQYGSKPVQKRQRQKVSVIKYYSNGDMFCECCGKEGLEYLTIDHIEEDGKQHRQRIGGGSRIYSWIIENNFPSGFRILCWNCNEANYTFGSCPHKWCRLNECMRNVDREFCLWYAGCIKGE